MTAICCKSVIAFSVISFEDKASTEGKLCVVDSKTNNVVSTRFRECFKG